MAQIDYTLVHKNDQKKELSVFASGVLPTAADMDYKLANLPVASLVTGVYVVTETPSGAAASDNVTVKVGNVTIGENLVVGAKGVDKSTSDGTFLPSGGELTVVAGADAPDDAGLIRVVVEYIEVNLTKGTYTA